MSPLPPFLTGTVTQVLRYGFNTKTRISDEDFLIEHLAYWPRYRITYVAEGRRHHLMLDDDGKGGFEAKVTRAVRLDLERRRYIECRDEGLTLPLVVSL